MIKYLLVAGVVALAAAGAYAMVAGEAKKKRVANELEATDASDDCCEEPEWKVEFVDKNKNPITPVSVQPTPAPGYEWNSPAKASDKKPAATKQRARSNCPPDKIPSSGKPGG